MLYKKEATQSGSLVFLTIESNHALSQKLAMDFLARDIASWIDKTKDKKPMAGHDYIPGE